MERLSPHDESLVEIINWPPRTGSARLNGGKYEAVCVSALDHQSFVFGIQGKTICVAYSAPW